MLVPIDKLADRELSAITCIVIHHSVAHETLDITDIDRMEKQSQGFVCVGYNAYCKKQNDLWVIQEGRPADKLPAAQYGMNTEGYAICIGGNYEPGAAPFLTAVSDQALKVVADHIHQVKAKAPNLKYLIGHRDVAVIKQHQGQDPATFATLCPGSDLYAKLAGLRASVGLGRYPGL